MPIDVKQSVAQSIDVWLADSTDGKTAKTSATLAGFLAKYGAGSFTSISPSVTERGVGHYDVALTTTHMNTVGLCSLYFTASGADQIDTPNLVEVCAFDKTDAVRGTAGTALPAVASGSAGAIPTTGSGANQIAVDGAGNVSSDVKKWLAATPDALSSGKLPADVKLWLTGTPDALSSGKIPADIKLWLTVATNALSSGRVDATVGAMQADVMTAAAAAGDLTTELQSGLATATALSTAQTAITSIKTKTDQLVFTVANMVDSNVIDWKSATAAAMTGDAYARLGAPAVSVSADIAAIQSDTNDIQSRLPATLDGLYMRSKVESIADDAITAASIAGDAITLIANGVMASVVEGIYTFEQLFRGLWAVVLGNGLNIKNGVTPQIFYGANGTTERVSSDNTDGVRTNTLDLS